MNVEIKKAINREKWLEAMHARGDINDELRTKLDEAEKMLVREAAPKAVYRVMEINEVSTCGFSIKKHLEGCSRVAVMGLTLGMGIDNLLRRTQIRDMALTVMLDCGASVMVEQLCDEFEEKIKQETKEKYSTFRFSPGYGDYPLSDQGRIARYLDASRKIGLTVTGSSLMIPRKSVTALIGLADHPVKGRLATCGECVLKEKCTLRKEGKFCGD
ncbi:MAG: vitamin B12 dependent-methionine synthase activation domain-containing protein [Bacillota bacterium]|nr:vitamin B12 dependent-methionine synthase activation domain-containing protein [Bacillota bacterium]